MSDKSKLRRIKKPPTLVQRAMARLNSAVVAGDSQATVILLREQLSRVCQQTGYALSREEDN